ncbi:hypothetical protein ACJIZ3_016330 [Penstemon smallii]|uniref:RRM domain-containing protein n=1 Tax=Penstemon smallii TaxID=265156 RepID=A0ABD3RSG7_9LAMI
MEGDDRTFRANFSTEGVARLRERVNVKLKEFMGDYTDDTLVEYVIVLLKNGRRKDEARSELNVFLGDDSDAFVAWLWDHLGSNLSLYVQPRDPLQYGAPKTKSVSVEPVGRTELHKIEFETSGEPARRTESETEKGNSRKPFGNHHKRKWKGSVRDVDENEVSLPQSSIAEYVNPQYDPHERVGPTKQLLSPRRTIQKKRRQPKERQPKKREVSQTTVSAQRRLLQFAVRDALATSRPSSTSTEPSLKRLRSVVSTSTRDSFLGERSQRILPVAGLRTAMSAAIKAVAEAVKDVSKVRSSSNVFDRLGHSTDVSNATYHQEDYRDVVEDGLGLDHIREIKDTRLTHHLQNNSNMRQDVNLSSFHDETVMASDLGYVGEGYDGVDVIGRGAMDISHSHTSGGIWVQDSLIIRSSEADNFDERALRQRKDLDQSAAALAAAHNASLKISSSVDMNTRKIPRYQDVREVSAINDRKLIQDVDTMAIKTDEWLMKSNNAIVAVNGNAKPDMGRQHLTPAGLYTTGPSTEDADLRTIFVSNVHFAATKDSLSRHFNRFGEVLKVIILTDPASSQPKGSAYVEFMRKEAAEHALSMDGTSFMSRILKIIKKSSAQPEAPSASAMAWPRTARASPFAVPRFGRIPFARGGPSLYRGGRGRSLQWKREAQPTGQASNIILQPPTTRNRTYVRTEPKTAVQGNFVQEEGGFIKLVND